jgi:hypothetical protein
MILCVISAVHGELSKAGGREVGGVGAYHSPRIDHMMTTSAFILIYARSRNRFGLKSLHINPPDFGKLK